MLRLVVIFIGFLVPTQCGVLPYSLSATKQFRHFEEAVEDLDLSKLKEHFGRTLSTNFNGVSHVSPYDHPEEVPQYVKYIRGNLTRAIDGMETCLKDTTDGIVSEVIKSTQYAEYLLSYTEYPVSSKIYQWECTEEQKADIIDDLDSQVRSLIRRLNQITERSKLENYFDQRLKNMDRQTRSPDKYTSASASIFLSSRYLVILILSCFLS